jgi:hypothetical protein
MFFGKRSRFVFCFIIFILPIESNAQESYPKIEIKYELTEDLRKCILRSLKPALSDIPEDVRNELSKCKDQGDILKSPDYVQKWVNENISYFSDVETAQAFNRLTEDVLKSGDYIDGDAISQILELSFLSMLNGKPFDLNKSITDTVAYWRENRTPNIKFSPQGLGKIQWTWKIRELTRYEGVIHVGLDIKKRTFICYEYGKGLYFPEGDIMERIYSEIVQDPIMAGTHIGKGRK